VRWQELVQAFDLEAETEAFVAKRVAELVQDKQSFRFRGTCRNCGQDGPHAPHVTDHYDTVRYGWLEGFCLGREGTLDVGALGIVVTGQEAGSADWPGSAEGYWFVCHDDLRQ